MSLILTLPMVWDASERSCTGGLQHQLQVPALGLCPSSASGEGRAWRREQPGPCAAEPKLPALPALAGAAPPASAHWLMGPLGINYAFRTRGYSNGKIVYLQLGELKAEAEERVAPPCPPAPFSRLPKHGRGWIQLPPSRHFQPGGTRGFPAPPNPFLPPFPREVGVCCLPSHSSVAGRIQPISPSADFPP